MVGWLKGGIVWVIYKDLLIFIYDNKAVPYVGGGISL